MHGTRLRTWLLVAGTTALLIAVGALAGGLLLYVFVGLAVLVNVAGYRFSDRFALRAGRARPLEGAETAPPRSGRFAFGTCRHPEAAALPDPVGAAAGELGRGGIPGARLEHAAR
jgi:hypothetical protein